MSLVTSPHKWSPFHISHYHWISKLTITKTDQGKNTKALMIIETPTTKGEGVVAMGIRRD